MSGDMPFGICRYCREASHLRVTYFRFPINCDCCSSTHSERVEHCNKCEAKMPSETRIWIDTKKILDPIFEELFKKVP